MGNGQSIAPAFRPWSHFQEIINEMDDSVRKRILSEFRQVNEELRVQEAVTKQLEEDLALDAIRNHMDGTIDSPLYRTLPVEIRQAILSYVVTVDQSVHVFPPKGNDGNGFRLSLCEEPSYDLEMGHCRCDDNPARNRVQSDFFDNAVFLVSQRMRREALDAFFMTNTFTFTCLHELVRFTATFKRSSSRIQRLRILERVDDYPSSDIRLEGVQKARLRLQSLKHLDLHVYLSTWSAYESVYEDGLVHQLLHFALGPPPVVRKTKRKASCLDDDFGSSDSSIGNVRVAESKGNPTISSTVSDAASGDIGTDPQSQPSTSSVLRTRLHTYNALTSTEIGRIFPIYPHPHGLTSIFARSKFDDFSSPLSSSTTPAPTCTDTSIPAFPIPPLRSFKAHITTRTHLRPLAPTDAKAAYYEALYARLKCHLEDVFLDNGKRYRRVEDVPSLGPRPRSRPRDEERPFTGAEKRGLLILKD